MASASSSIVASASSVAEDSAVGVGGTAVSVGGGGMVSVAATVAFSAVASAITAWLTGVPSRAMSGAFDPHDARRRQTSAANRRMLVLFINLPLCPLTSYAFRSSKCITIAYHLHLLVKYFTNRITNYVVKSISKLGFTYRYSF
jgi:hypothetical protein